MFPSSAISRTHLARNTRQTIEQARRGQAILVESYGEEQVAIVGFITVGGVVTHPAADSKPDMSVSPHPASRSIGC
jgi:hypothetical protein